ncbi:casein kinase II beta subunit [Basidiobolus meristosporus CBS 931.73]|uniref:Casein kinase II subunit beta n=1 Tax=Basidiobolus meristosporus CBS 931.73 TaxID=1314790 RepID=A0A1Y1XZ24_9FUNG|nr:casein kinase II beta subunit [Basidiobolus meristosporus CBS 931.73]|eukprot:ORX90972.1 casein kinase II beta subunit [Basidiobolus meristosporus CBS 931.73]
MEQTENLSPSVEECTVFPAPSAVSSQKKANWITWFCSLPGKEYLLRATESFLKDGFNTVGLETEVPFYQEALEMIRDIQPKRPRPDVDTNAIKASAERLYCMLHQRYILTRQGMHEMASRYDRGDFGCCPRYYCNGTLVIPTGKSDSLDVEPVKLYCPNCLDLYTPPNSPTHSLDGAFFGTTFAHLFLMTYSPSTYSHFKINSYKPRIYGFKVSELSEAGPRHQWLRARYNLNDNISDSATDSDISSDSEEGHRLRISKQWPDNHPSRSCSLS